MLYAANARWYSNDISYLEGVKQGKGQWEYIATMYVGIGIIASPFMLGFGNISTALWTSLVIGALIALFAGSRLTSGQIR